MYFSGLLNSFSLVIYCSITSTSILNMLRPVSHIILKKAIGVPAESIIEAKTFYENNDLSEMYHTNNVLIDSNYERLYHYLENAGNEGTYHEILSEPHARLFFDIDCNDKHVDNTYEARLNILLELEVAIIDTLNAYHYNLINDLQMELNPKNINTTYLTRSAVYNVSKNKLSMHVIYSNIIMTLHDMKEFVHKMANNQKFYSITQYIDTQVYRKDATLRTIFSCKTDATSNKLIKNEKLMPMIIDKDIGSRLPLKATSYFINHIDTEITIYPMLQNYNNASQLSLTLENLFNPNRIKSINTIQSFATQNTKTYQSIEIEYTNNCGLCKQRVHKSNFYLIKQYRDNGQIVYYLKKNGTCLGITSLPIYTVGKSKQGGDEYGMEEFEDKLYQISIDIYSEGNIRKTTEGCFIWHTDYKRWERTEQKDLGNFIIKFMNYHKDSLTDEVKIAIQRCNERKILQQNLYDIMSCYDFPTPPSNYVMLYNGLFDINTKSFVVNNKDYNVPCRFNVIYQPLDINKSKVEELKQIIDKIYCLPIEGLSDIENNKRKIQRSRFEQAIGGLLYAQNKSQVFHFCGKANGGKSVIMDLIINCMGSYAYKGSIDVLKQKNASTNEAMALYKNKLVAVISELPIDFVIEEHKLKSITEGQMTADKKYENTITFPNNARTMIDSNYHLEVSTVDESIEKRIQSFLFISNFSGTNTEDDYISRKFVRSEDVRNKVLEGYFNNEFFLFMLDCYQTHFYLQSRIVSVYPNDNSTLLHNARAEELKTYIKRFPHVTRQSLVNSFSNEVNDSRFLDKHCPLLSSMIKRKSKDIKFPLSLAIEVLNLQGFVFPSDATNKAGDETETENESHPEVNKRSNPKPSEQGKVKTVKKQLN